jgi:hypothetical protein
MAYSKIILNIKSLIFNSSVTTTAVSQLQQCHNYSSVTTTAVSQLQQCHNYNSVTTTTLSQLKMCDFSGETFKGFEVL